MIALVALVTLTLASCQKSYECECSTLAGETTESHKGSDAADACADATSVLEMKVCTPKQ